MAYFRTPSPSGILNHSPCFISHCSPRFPQYYENPPTSVKNRILHLIELWARNLPDQPKIREVKTMLIKQGVYQHEHTHCGRFGLASLLHWFNASSSDGKRDITSNLAKPSCNITPWRQFAIISSVTETPPKCAPRIHVQFHSMLAYGPISSFSSRIS